MCANDAAYCIHLNVLSEHTILLYPRNRIVDFYLHLYESAIYFDVKAVSRFSRVARRNVER